MKEMMTFSDQVREAIQAYRGEEFHALDLADKMNLNKIQKKRMYSILNQMVKQNKEAKRLKPGTYRYIGRKNTPLEQVAWRILRARRKVTVPDLEEMAEMGEHYARSWLKMLEGRGIVKKVGGGGGQPFIWQLIHDTVQMPANTVMKEKHRKRRARRQKALVKIEAAEKALNEARKLLTEGDDE